MSEVDVSRGDSMSAGVSNGAVDTDAVPNVLGVGVVAAADLDDAGDREAVVHDRSP